jgi:uncharacterized membrane protein
MTSRRAAITVLRSREELQELWNSSEYRPGYIESADVTVSFKEAPGDRGTEIYVDLHETVPGGKLGEALAKLLGKEPLAKVKDDLRRFKQHVETGVITRSDAAPEGELAEGKLRQRPGQPLDESERREVGV